MKICIIYAKIMPYLEEASIVKARLYTVTNHLLELIGIIALLESYVDSRQHFHAVNTGRTIIDYVLNVSNDNGV